MGLKVAIVMTCFYFLKYPVVPSTPSCALTSMQIAAVMRGC